MLAASKNLLAAFSADVVHGVGGGRTETRSQRKKKQTARLNAVWIRLGCRFGRIALFRGRHGAGEAATVATKKARSGKAVAGGG